MRRPRHLGAIGVFLGVIATVPEWADLAFYARGDSIPIVFCTDLVVTWRFVCLVLCWVAASLICYLGHGGLSFDAEVDTD